MDRQNKGASVKKTVERITVNGGDISRTKAELALIREEPLSIRIQGKPYTVVMRTPGEEISHVAGFCLGEGIVDSPDDFVSLGYCDGDVNVVTAVLTPECRARVSGIIDRRGFISQTSCGICGKELIDDLRQSIPKVEGEGGLNGALVVRCMESLADHQPLRNETRAAHGVAFFSKGGGLLAAAEDVGRHNALDKASGRLFLDKRLHEAAYLVLSSRASYEMIQKAARAKIQAVFSLSRPTALAVSLAEELGMTLACLDGKNGLYVFCGAGRLIGG
jgi:FdhD protein